MEKRAILACVLSILATFAYMMLTQKFAPPAPVPPPPPEAAPDKEPPTSAPPSETDKAAAGTRQKSPSEPPPDTQETVERVETALESANYHATFDNRAGVLKRLIYKHFTDQNGNALAALDSAQIPDTTGALTLRRAGRQQAHPDLVRRNWEIVEQAGDRISYRTAAGDMLGIRKEFALHPARDTMEMSIDLHFTNHGSTPITFEYLLNGGTGIHYESTTKGTRRGLVAGLKPAGATDVEHEYMESLVKKRDKPLHYSKLPIAWVAISSQYFVSLLAPEDPAAVISGTVDVLDAPDPLPDNPNHGRPLLRSRITSREITLAPGESLSHHFTLYTGPLSEKYMQDRPRFASVIQYGWFSGISQLLLGILNLFYRITGNYGFAILMLTLAMRLLMHPLTRKQHVSMHGLQKLGPKMKEIKEKYKNDQQKMQRATMELYRKEGVNPFASCLPMVLQMPIFLGMFRLLRQAFELRQAPFILWIRDLARPDCLMKLPFTIPLLGTNCFNILPLLMTATSILQQRMMPKPQDAQAAQQQKMMMFMMIFFLFILYNFASGLSLYWFTSNLFGIVEQKLLRRRLQK